MPMPVEVSSSGTVGKRAQAAKVRRMIDSSRTTTAWEKRRDHRKTSFRSGTSQINRTSVL